MFRPFLYALIVVCVLVVGAFAYIAFAPLPVEAKPVIQDIAVGDILKEGPARIEAAQPATPPAP